MRPPRKALAVAGAAFLVAALLGAIVPVASDLAGSGRSPAGVRPSSVLTAQGLQGGGSGPTLRPCPKTVRGVGSCSEPGGDPAAQGSFGGTGETARPADGPGSPEWFNTTPEMGRVLGISGGALAYDPLAQEMLLFGGCGTVCPGNATWAYDGLNWTNLTPSLAREANGLPPALNGFALAWDPDRAGVLLTGGAYASGTASNATWLWTSSGWQNLTLTVNNRSLGLRGSPDEAYGSMAYDGALHEMVVVDGCSSVASGCGAHLQGETYVLGGNGSLWANLNATFAPKGAEHPATGNGGFGATMAYDAASQELVYYGGEDASGAVQNATWIMNATGWYNVTSTAYGCLPSPATCDTHYYPGNGSAFGGMTWDGQVGEVVLVGGLDRANGTTNDTSIFAGGEWFPLCNGTCAAPLPSPEQGSELASNSSDVAPLLVEGRCASQSHCIGDDWVLEVPPEPAVSVSSPLEAEVGVGVHVGVSVMAGTGSGPVVGLALNATDLPTFTQTISAVNFSATPHASTVLTYAHPGTYSLVGTATDFFGIEGTSATVPLVVNASVAAAPVASPDPTEVGFPVDFSAHASAGAPPYNFSWDFGDSATAYGASPQHAYATAGNYSGWVVVTDADGVSVNRSVNVTVYARLIAEAATSRTTADVGVEIEFAGRGTGGSGSYPHYAWTFGDGGSNATAYANHTYVANGTFVPRLTVTDSSGFQADVTTTIHVNSALEVSAISASTDAPTTGTKVTFNVTVRDGTPGYIYLWSFPDGISSVEPVASYTFGSAGEVTVSLTVLDEGGGYATKKLALTVTSPPPDHGLLGDLGKVLGPYGLVAGIVGASLLLVVLVLLRPRRRRPSDEGPSSEEATPSEVSVAVEVPPEAQLPPELDPPGPPG